MRKRVFKSSVLGAVLCLTIGFLALTSERLTPARVEDDDAR